jgi:hypothetical protein
MAKEIKEKKLKPPEDIFRAKGISWKKLDGEIPYLETSADRLYNMVQGKQKVNFAEAGDGLGLTKEQMIALAGVLEEHGLIKVHYPIRGSPVMMLRTEEKKMFIKEEDRKKRQEGKKTPKVLVAGAGALLVFFGYVTAVSNPFTISMRSQLASTLGKISGIFWFLPYPLNVIMPLVIIIVVLWAFFGLRHRKKGPKKKEANKKVKIKKR